VVIVLRVAAKHVAPLNILKNLLSINIPAWFGIKIKRGELLLCYPPIFAYIASQAC